MQLVNLKIKNFRSIGSIDNDHAVNLEIDDNNLIFLCGCNNAGKSTVMAAYEMFVVAERKAEHHDFHNRDTGNHIEIEASIRAENAADLAHQALVNFFDANGIARIRKVWSEVGEKGRKESFNPTQAAWQPGGAGGFDALLQNACPTPVWIRGSSTPEDILGLLRSLVQETILRSISSQPVYANALEAVRQLDSAIVQHEYSVSLGTNLNAAISSIFPNVSFSIKNDAAKDVIELFKTTATVEISEVHHPDLGIESHGHGVRRQFILSAFRGLAMQFEEVKKKSKTPETLAISAIVEEAGMPKSRMLLVEEPELFLHPAAIRGVRNLLFLLASSSEFQVMAATHCPVVIDLARPHTTLVRVATSEDEGTRIYQVSSSLFSDGERDQMKMLNYFDPYVCEAFFASKVILVEGDTEAVAIRELIARMREIAPTHELDELHVVNCGTKMNIPFFQKVLTHFRIPHHVFHDMDQRTSANGNQSPAWTLNEHIWSKIEAAQQAGVPATRYVFNSEFESANGYQVDESVGKPYSAYREASQWDLEDESKASIKYLRMVLSGEAPTPSFSQTYLDELVPA